MKALTIKQPWAWAIAAGGKDIENRSWATQHHGRLAIHAGSAWDGAGAMDDRVINAVTAAGGQPPKAVRTLLTDQVVELLRDKGRFIPGAVIAVARLVDVCTAQSSCTCGPWAVPGQCHWRLAVVRPLHTPVPCKGRLGLWDLPEAVKVAVLAQLRIERSNAHA